MWYNEGNEKVRWKGSTLGTTLEIGQIMLTEAERLKYEKIAKMLMANIAQADIATACNLSESAISQIKQNEEFQSIYSTLSSEQFQINNNINEGLDALEQHAILSLLSTLKWSQDPEFALKALRVANTSKRHGAELNQPITPENGSTVTLHLKQTFIENLQTKNQTVVYVTDDKKQQDVLAPDKVKQVLTDMEEDMLAELPTFLSEKVAVAE